MKRNIFFFLLLSVSVIAQQQDSSIIFVSDTQQPLWIETLRLEEHDNKKATKIIFRAIEHETTAVAIFHLGDFTSIGMFDSYWGSFDEFYKNIRVPLYPIMGNHEYYLLQKPALKQFRKRFPSITTSWYSVVVKAVAIIALNSNFSQLSDKEISQQDRWYWEQLSKFEADSTISSIIVLCHHSPYTNSTIVDPSLEVQHQFLDPFLTHHKTSVFISGHAHAYEHFQKDGKEFLVIGGGGGLLQPLLTGTEQRFHDLFDHDQSLRFFHYVKCSIQKDFLEFSVDKLRSDRSGFDVVDSIRVQFQ
jgi:predicted phosphodiesterase